MWGSDQIVLVIAAAVVLLLYSSEWPRTVAQVWRWRRRSVGVSNGTRKTAMSFLFVQTGMLVSGVLSAVRSVDPGGRHGIYPQAARELIYWAINVTTAAALVEVQYLTARLSLVASGGQEVAGKLRLALWVVWSVTTSAQLFAQVWFNAVSHDYQIFHIESVANILNFSVAALLLQAHFLHLLRIMRQVEQAERRVDVVEVSQSASHLMLHTPDTRVVVPVSAPSSVHRYHVIRRRLCGWFWLWGVVLWGAVAFYSFLWKSIFDTLSDDDFQGDIQWTLLTAAVLCCNAVALVSFPFTRYVSKQVGTTQA